MKYLFFIIISLFISSCESGSEISSENEVKEIIAEDEAKINCPKCGLSKIDKFPTEVFQLRYECTECGEILFRDEVDCCVFFTYSDKKCPSKQ